MPPPAPRQPEKRQWYEEVVIPALLRGARNTYSTVIRQALAGIGCDDVPSNGIFVLGAVHRTGAPLSGIIEMLGVSKQAGGQLVDTLVTRRYLDRFEDPEDRRRLRVALTERGRVAAAASREAIEEIEEELVRRLGAPAVVKLRSALATLIDMGES